MLKIQLKYFKLFLFLVVFINGFSQDSTLTFGFKGTVHHGSILPHRQIVNEVIEGHSLAYELSVYKLTRGLKNWQQLYNYPKIGLSILSINLGNKQELGMGYGVFPFVEFPINRKQIGWRIKMGYGLGYIQHPFDRETNYKNLVIGSHLNALLFMNSLWSVQLWRGISMSGGISLIHYSNGSFARPNLGINVFSLNGGLAYDFGKKQVFVSGEVPERPRDWTHTVMTGFGLKEIPPVDGPKYFVSSYSYNLIKKRSNKSSFGVGLDFFYNTSLSDLIVNSNSDYERTSLDNYRLGIVGIYSFDFSKISLLIEMGGYVFTKHKKQGIIYHRITSRYNINEKVFALIGLKTHYAVADFIEVGIGYRFKNGD